jgi:hypothetical protein
VNENKKNFGMGEGEGNMKWKTENIRRRRGKNDEIKIGA